MCIELCETNLEMRWHKGSSNCALHLYVCSSLERTWNQVMMQDMSFHQHYLSEHQPLRQRQAVENGTFCLVKVLVSC